VTAVGTNDAIALFDSWDLQQSALVAQREERFDLMLEVIAERIAQQGRSPAGEGLRVLDLACGPASIAWRVLRRFPESTVIGVDVDPALLAIADAAVGARSDGRFRTVRADLSGDWVRELPAEAIGRIDAVVSATALHWLDPATLTAVYAACHPLLADDGVLMNADHLRYDVATQPALRRLAERDDERTQAMFAAEGAMSWDAWWERVRATPGLADAARERDAWYAGRGGPVPRASLEFHLAALRAAGFAETGVLYQRYDNLLVYARR